MKTFCRLAIIAVASPFFQCCTTTTVTSPDGTITSTRRPDPKTLRQLRGAVETIGAAAAQQAIREMAEQQPR